MKIKKILAATLAATMVMASAMTVCATTGTAGSGSSSSSESASSESASSESAASVTEAEKAALAANATVSVAGRNVKTTVAGVYAARTVQGCAITTDLATVKANLSLEAGQTPKVVIYDTDAKKSYLAIACVDAAAEALGANVVASLNIDLGAIQNGKWVTLSNGNVAMAVGLPKTADTTKVYSVVCVQPGGTVTVLEDQDANPNTVTFEIKAGLGTYAVVAK